MVSEEKQITSTNVIYYETVVDYAIDMIVRKCDNVESNRPSRKRRQPDISNYPEFGNTEYLISEIIHEQTKIKVTGLNNGVNKGCSGPQTPSEVNSGHDDTARGDISHRIYLKPSGISYENVDRDKIKQQFISYLTINGIASKTGSIMTTKSIINIFSHFATFLTAKIYCYMSRDNNYSKKYVLYNDNDVSFDKVLCVDNGQFGFDQQLETFSLTDIFNAITNIKNVNNNELIVRYSSSSSSSSCSCSCSSCSCSSSSSSSCSSSSSSYIVYMLI